SEPLLMVSGVSCPFLMGCHSAAMSGRIVAKVFDGTTTKPWQQPQPFPEIARLPMMACHSWSFILEHFHHTFRSEPAVTSFGVRVPFLDGCHSATRWGWDISNETLYFFACLTIS